MHRRYIAFLERQLLKAGADRVSISLQLLKTRGWVIENVAEENELGENRLMAAAAEGKDSVLQLLVDASASVNSSRQKDGVTAMWLAAQFGHTRTVAKLAELNADVNLCARDGASPVYIASQGGNWECVEELVVRNADLGLEDKKGMLPVHQAAMNGHEGCIRVLYKYGAVLDKGTVGKKMPLDLAEEYNHPECASAIKKLRESTTEKAQSPVKEQVDGSAAQSRKLIISTGDVSDVDGFMALAEYARTGLDVLFVMNYPAYIGVAPDDIDGDYAEKNPGKGYRYSATQVLKTSTLPSPLPEKYVRFLEEYGESISDNDRVKCAMTDMVFAMAVGVWSEARPAGSAGRFFFYIGGVNSINPFSETATKNEVLVYSDIIQRRCAPLKAHQDLAYDDEGRESRVDWAAYSDIYMDFNGSLAFWNESWEAQLGTAAAADRFRGVFIMGGVYDEVEPVTMPAIPGVLNRFSSATMNQLYHPECAAAFLAFLAQRQIRSFIVANKVVQDLTTTDPVTKAKTYDGVERFMRANGLAQPFLQKLAEAHYMSRYNPPRKPFDFYAAMALTAWLQSSGNPEAEERLCLHKRTLHYSNVFGVTYISRSGLWEDTRAAYLAAVDTAPRDDDSPFVRSKKEYFLKEMAVLMRIEFMGRLPVFDVHFRTDAVSGRLGLADDREESSAAAGAPPAAPAAT